MNRHPIPQDIMSVEFKLFGELTIKQFLYVGGGGLLAYLAFASEMPFLIKIFLAILFGGGGAAFALIPINNRPLEVWVANFLIAMFSPTKMVWKKGVNPSAPRTVYTSNPNQMAPTIPRPVVQMPQPPVMTNTIHTAATNDLISTEATFQAAPVTPPQVPPMAPAAPISPVTAPVSAEPAVATAPTSPSNLPSASNNMKMEAPMTNNQDIKKLEEVITTAQVPRILRQTFILDVTKLQDHGATLPGYQAKPNMVKGVVKDKDGNLVPGAVVIIKRKENGLPARAMVTNPLGEFETSTSLENGVYLIDISHGEKEMPLYELALDSAPVPPMQFQFTA